MPKHKKTLEQKRKSDMKKSSVISIPSATGSTSLPSFTFQTYHPQHTTTPMRADASSLIAHGLQKTLIVSSIIVILQLAFFFLLTHHMLVLPFKIIQY